MIHCPRAFFSVLMLISSTSSSALNCAEAKLDVEKTICNSHSLRSADDSLAVAYIAALQKSNNRKQLTESQRNWIADVRNACNTEQCLTGAYARRNKELINGAVGVRKTAFETEYFCWKNLTSETAPRVLEIQFYKRPDGSYENTAFVRKYDNIAPAKIGFQKTISALETSPNRPLEFTQFWREKVVNGRASAYEIVSQSFPRHIEYFPNGRSGKSVGYEPVGVSSDSSCFEEALAATRKPQ